MDIDEIRNKINEREEEFKDQQNNKSKFNVIRFTKEDTFNVEIAKTILWDIPYKKLTIATNLAHTETELARIKREIEVREAEMYRNIAANRSFKTVDQRNKELTIATYSDPLYKALTTYYNYLMFDKRYFRSVIEYYTDIIITSINTLKNKNALMYDQSLGGNNA